MENFFLVFFFQNRVNINEVNQLHRVALQYQPKKMKKNCIKRILQHKDAYQIPLAISGI